MGPCCMNGWSLWGSSSRFYRVSDSAVFESVEKGKAVWSSVCSVQNGV